MQCSLSRLFVAGLAALSVGTVAAQYNPLTPSMAYMGMARASTLHRVGQDALNRSGHSAFSTPAPASAVTAGGSGGIGALFGSGKTVSNPSFDFTPSSTVSEQVRRRMIDAVVKADPSQQAAAEKTFDSRLGILKEYDHLLSNYGYSSHNLLDVYTGYVVIAWEIVNGTDASSNAAGIRAVHAQLERSMLASPAVVQLSPGIKQDTAEVLSYQAALAGNAKNELLKRGDTAALQQLRTNVAASAADLGIDVRRLRLTDQGLIASN